MKATVWNPLPCLLRQRERVTSSSRFPRRHRLLFGLVVTIGVLVYAAFNVWVYQYSKSGKATSPSALWQTITASRAGFGVLKGDSLSNSSPAPTPSPSPTPTPTPRPTGPGEYACDPYGVCNRYGDAARLEFCPVTYADSLCLDQCGDKEKQCAK